MNLAPGFIEFIAISVAAQDFWYNNTWDPDAKYPGAMVGCFDTPSPQITIDHHRWFKTVPNRWCILVYKFLKHCFNHMNMFDMV